MVTREEKINRALFSCAMCMLVFAMLLPVCVLDERIEVVIISAAAMFFDGIAMGWSMVFLGKAFRYVDDESKG